MHIFGQNAFDVVIDCCDISYCMDDIKHFDWPVCIVCSHWLVCGQSCDWLTAVSILHSYWVTGFRSLTWLNT